MDDQQQPPPPPPSGDDSTFRDMTKTQLYEVMCEMKELIDQDKEQVRQILVDNPLLTRHLFQAQIMLGMVRPSQVTPNNQKASSDSQSTQVAPESEGQNFQPLPVEVGQHGPAISSSQPLVPARQQNPVQTTASAPPVVFQLQPNLSGAPLSAPETKGFSNALVSSAAPSQSSQIHNVPMQHPPAPQYSVTQPQLVVSSQAQSLQTPGLLHQPPAPPFPQQSRPPSVQPFSHQLHPEVPHGFGFQQSSHPLLSQPIFHPGNNHPSFPQGQPPLPIQPPSQQHHQGGPYVGPDYGNQVGTSMQSERAPWSSGMQERAMMGAQLLGPPLSITPGHMGEGVGSQPPRPPPLSREMEKALLQQVMSLTPEQIHLLPAEQRQQVIQLQEMLRNVGGN